MISLNKRYERFCDGGLAFLRAPAGALLWAALLVIALVFANTSLDPDLLARVAVGRLVQLLGYVPSVDPFAFTPKKELWIDHEWLAGVIFYRTARATGDAGLLAGKTLVALYSMLWLLRARRAYSGPGPLPVFWWLITIFGVCYVWGSTVRSQIFTYFFLPLTLSALVEHQRYGRRGPLLLLPLAMIVWVNAHGGFVVGLGLLAIYGLLQTWRGRAAALPLLSLALCLAATAVNPYGFSTYWSYILHAVTLHRGMIAEWSSLPVLSGPAVIPDILAILIALGICRERRSLDPIAVAMIAVSAFFGYRHVRLIAVFLMVAFVYGGPCVESALEVFKSRFRGFGAALGRSAAALALIGLPLAAGAAVRRVAAHGFELNYGEYPVAACEWLWRNRKGGDVLVDFNNGSMALWRLFPHFRVSLDGRYEELYPDETVRLVGEALSPGRLAHEEALKAVNPDVILLDKRIAAPPEFGPGWQTVYQDDGFAVLERPERARPRVPASAAPLRPMWEPGF